MSVQSVWRVHEEVLEMSLEVERGWAHTARAAEVGLKRAGRHSHNAICLGRLPAQEVVLVLPRGLMDTQSEQTQPGQCALYVSSYHRGSRLKGALRHFEKITDNNPDDVIRVIICDHYGFVAGSLCYKVDKCGDSPDRKQEVTIRLHSGKCRLQLFNPIDYMSWFWLVWELKWLFD